MSDTPGTTRDADYPVLSRPPITEVVCGFVFTPLAALDALEFGVYWDSRKTDFPKKSIHPALLDTLQDSFIDMQALRAWLISRDNAFIVQLQNDRFYMNWRSIGSVYPRFGNHGSQRGLMGRALDEFGKFGDFCSSRLNERIDVHRIELSKIDVFVKGKDWSDLEDLAGNRILTPKTATDLSSRADRGFAAAEPAPIATTHDR